MKWTVGLFWVVLAVLYLVLATVSLLSGRAYDRQIAKAPAMKATAGGGTTIEGPPGMSVTLFGSSDAQRNLAVADLWADLRAYLNAATWVNFFGFLLAATAAVVSLASGRRSSGGVTVEPTAETPRAGA
jgi:hypothetical protein